MTPPSWSYQNPPPLDQPLAGNNLRMKHAGPGECLGLRSYTNALRFRLRAGRGQPADVRRLLPLGAGGDVELHRLTFAKGLEAIPLDRGIMDEHVLPVLRRDEPVTLLVTEPLDSTFSHECNYLRSEEH